MRNSKKIRLLAMMVALALLLGALPTYAALADGESPSPSPATTTPILPPPSANHIELFSDVTDDEEKGLLQTYSQYAGESITFYVPIINKNLENATGLSCALQYTDPTDVKQNPFAATPEIKCKPYKTWNSTSGKLEAWDGSALAIGERAYFQVTATFLATIPADSYNLKFTITYGDGSTSGLTDTIPVAVFARDKTDSGNSSGGGGSGYKSKPKVIIESYSFSEDTIYAGDIVTLRLVIANTSKREAVTNVQLDFSNEAGAILPAPGGSSSVFIGTIDKEKAYVLSIKLQIMPDADAKSQPLAIKLTYEGTRNRADFDEAASVSVPVMQKARVRINDPIVYDDPWVGTNVAVGVTLYNLGKSPLYNCMVDVVGDGLTLEESYFGGNVAAGGTMRADLSVTPTMAGKLDAQVRVTYEDVNGKQTETLLPLNMVVNEEPAGGVTSNGNGGMVTPGDAPANANIGWIFWVLGGVAVVTGLVFLGVKMKKKRERALEEE